LITIVYNDNVYVANLGDAKARLFRKNEYIVGRSDSTTYESIKLMHRHNASKKREQARLSKLFPNDSDIFICKDEDNTLCYVKGRLQVTRALGDFYLKDKIFTSPYMRKYTYFNGPYLLAEPEILIYTFDPKHQDKYLLLATDGVGDFLSSQLIAEMIGEKEQEDRTLKGKDIVNTCLDKAAKEFRISRRRLDKIQRNRRRIHDDITLILVKFQ